MEENALVLLIIAILPVLILCFFLYKKDVHKEPKTLLFSLFAGGIASGVITIILSIFLGAFIPFFSESVYNLTLLEKVLYIFISIALIEEGSKWIISYLISFNNRNFDESFDGVIYCGFASLGFAIFENIIYVLQNGYNVGLFRAFTAVPGHLCFGIFMGYFLSLAKIGKIKNDNNQYINNLLYSIIIPTLLHGLYDFFIFAKIEILALLWYIYIDTLLIASFIMVSNLAKNNKLFYKINKKCPKCNKETNGNFCDECGTKL